MDNPDFLLRKGWLSGGDTGKQERANMVARFDNTRSWVDPNGYRLSDRLWNAGDADRRQIDRIIKDGISRGLHPLQMTAALEAHLTPEGAFGDAFRPEGMARVTSASGLTRTPYVNRGLPNQRSVGKGNYAARRLARTEVSRAYNETARLAAMDNPFVESIRYALSPSHPEPDICDIHAKADPIGEGPGIYPKNTTNPSIPAHPQCLCHWEPYSEDVNLQDVVNRLRGDLGKPPIKQLPDGSWQLPTGTQPPLPGTPTAPISGTITPKGVTKAVEDARQFFNDKYEPVKIAKDQWKNATGGFSGRMTAQTNYRKVAKDVRLANWEELEKRVNIAGASVKSRVDEIMLSKHPEWLKETQAIADAQRVFMDKRNALIAITKRSKDYPRIRQEWLDARDARNKLLRGIDNKVDDWVMANRQALAEQRSMGSALKHNIKAVGQSKANAEQWIDSANPAFPTEWWESSVEQAKREQLKVAKTKRGYYSDADQQIALSDYRDQGVAVHEMQHRFDYDIIGANDAAQSFYIRRTGYDATAYRPTDIPHTGGIPNTPLVPLRKTPGYDWYGPSEEGVLDDFNSPYTGKRYDSTASEINTMAVQSLQGDDVINLLGDEDLHNHILGVLSVF